MWFELIAVLGTDLIHVPTNFQAEGITGDIETIVADMVEIADFGLAQKPPVRFVYEAMAWGRFVDTWEQAWEVVLLVNRPNFGICLDTFQIAGRIWADPTTASGLLEGGDLELKNSLSRMSSYIGKKPEKLFLVQTGDAERLSSPITKNHLLHVDGQDPRMTWSRNARLFADDPKGNCFLKGPVDQICHVIFNELKYTGWVSCEVYSTSLFDPDPSVPIQHARRAANGWKSVLKTLELERKDSEAVQSHRVSKEQDDYSWLPPAWRMAPTNMAIAFFVVVICTLCPLVLSKSTFA
jgi:4-hydroxyphenylpyruvate dioxygenase